MLAHFTRETNERILSITIVQGFLFVCLNWSDQWSGCQDHYSLPFPEESDNTLQVQFLYFEHIPIFSLFHSFTYKFV